MTRLLDLAGHQLTELRGRDLTEAIRQSEGRVVAAEVIGAVQPLLREVSNAELVAAMGADLLICNLFDVHSPAIAGLPQCEPDQVIRALQRLTGRVIGINLEPCGVPEGRLARADNARRAIELGVQFVVVTANPATGADNAAIIDGIAQVAQAAEGQLMVVGGRMHAAGASQAGSELVDDAAIRAYVAAGADVVLVPAPGTVPGITPAQVHGLVQTAHELGALALTSIGTSQEGADSATIRAIALACKQAGADVHHLGDGGFTGIADPRNIHDYSVTIRGVRHTWRRMAASINR
ncbi:hypothetical protein [Luteococcus sp. OSA5]|uniref:DUF7916 family protein n=1 Tax=Luteococcus sp. OSA5 TaxID=3401630 RepID=UPI003B42B6C9